MAPPKEQSPATERPIVTTEVRARQGITRHGVRHVLGWGLAGVVVVFAALYLVFFAGH